MKLSNNKRFSGKKKNGYIRRLIAIALVIAFATCSFSGDLRASSEGVRQDGASAEEGLQQDGIDAAEEGLQQDGMDTAAEEGLQQDTVQAASEENIHQDSEDTETEPADLQDPVSLEGDMAAREPETEAGKELPDVLELEVKEEPVLEQPDAAQAWETVEAAPYEEDFGGLMSLKELEELLEDEVGATMWEGDMAAANAPGAVQKARKAARAAETPDAGAQAFTYDIRYVNQNDRYDVVMTSDDNLKYQITYHTQQQYEPGEVMLRIPAKLVDKRGTVGGAITLGEDNASDIATPMLASVGKDFLDHPAYDADGCIAGSIKVSGTSFNCYLDGEDLVFFNYKTLAKGTNGAWQVLYRDIRLMDITDGAGWTLKPLVSIRKRTVQIVPPEEPDKPGTESISWSDWVSLEGGASLTGRIDSSVSITNVTKMPFAAQGRSYTPELYTKNQVEQYITGSLPDDMEVNDYRFVVWDVNVSGKANQMWRLFFTDTSSPKGDGQADGSEGQHNRGIVVRYKDNSATLRGSDKLPINGAVISSSADTSTPSGQFLEFTFLSNIVIFYEKRYLEDAGYGTLYCNFNR